MNDWEKEELKEKAKMELAQAWETHRQAFGPILDPAFQANPSVRIPLTAALNHISRKEIKRGIEILESLREQCACDADHAAWMFCIGLAFEMAGDQEKSVRWYQKAGKYGHRFYLPYLKVAKVSYQCLDYDTSAENYARGIECLLEGEQTAQTKLILASSYVNFCTVLTMMHRYDEAEKAWDMVKDYPIMPASFATGALLYAAKGDLKKMKECLLKLQKQIPFQYEPVKSRCEGILEGRNGHFSVIAFEEKAISAFWSWFEENAEKISLLFETEKEKALSLIVEQLKKVTPLFLVDPRISAKKTEKGICFVVDDLYAKTLMSELPRLFAACPKSLCDRFSFSVRKGSAL
jgi:tetratricopeptide (TPR) repeat protein